MLHISDVLLQLNKHTS